MAKYFSPEIETASRDYLHAVQSARLIKTVKRCYENIPFYKAKFDEIGLKPEDIHSIDDISKLPFTVKQDLRDHYPFGLLPCRERSLSEFMLRPAQPESRPLSATREAI